MVNDVAMHSMELFFLFREKERYNRVNKQRRLPISSKTIASKPLFRERAKITRGRRCETNFLISTKNGFFHHPSGQVRNRNMCFMPTCMQVDRRVY